MNPEQRTKFQQNTVLICLIIWSALMVAAMIAKLATPFTP